MLRIIVTNSEYPGSSILHIYKLHTSQNTMYCGGEPEQHHNIHILIVHKNVFTKSRLTIVSHEAKKKQAVHNERVSYLHVAPL